MSSYAHTLPGRPPEEWQPLDAHLHEVARRASDFTSAFGAEEWGRLAGLWHDLGKYSAEFQAYLESAFDSDDESGPMRGPDHSTAGAQHAVSVLPSGLGNLLAYIIAGHHSGLTDGISASESCLVERLK